MPDSSRLEIGARQLERDPYPPVALRLPAGVSDSDRDSRRAAAAASLRRATWGKQFLGSFGIFVIKLLALTLVVVIGVLAIVLAAPTSFALLILATVVAVLAAVGLVLVMGSAVVMVYSAATYRHVTNQPVAGFDALDGLPDPIVAAEGVAEAPGVVR